VAAGAQSFRLWFVVHFVVDYRFGLPLAVAPEFAQNLFRPPIVDPMTARLVGIGG